MSYFSISFSLITLNSICSVCHSLSWFTTITSIFNIKIPDQVIENTNATTGDNNSTVMPSFKPMSSTENGKLKHYSLTPHSALFVIFIRRTDIGLTLSKDYLKYPM